MKIQYVAPEAEIFELGLKHNILQGSGTTYDSVAGEAGENNGYNDYDEDF